MNPISVDCGNPRDRLEEPVTDHAVVDRVLAAKRYLVLGTADQAGKPWVSPVFFARLGHDRVCWVSSPESRHSRNIADRAAIAITVFDSTVEVGQRRRPTSTPKRASDSGKKETLVQALNARLPRGKLLSLEDVQPRGPLVIYRADLLHRFVLVRGGNSEPRKRDRHDAQGPTRR